MGNYREIKIIISFLLFSFQTENKSQVLHNLIFCRHGNLRSLIILLRSLKVEPASCLIFLISGKRNMASDTVFVLRLTKSSQLFVNIVQNSNVYFTNAPIFMMCPIFRRNRKLITFFLRF